MADPALKAAPEPAPKPADPVLKVVPTAPAATTRARAARAAGVFRQYHSSDLNGYHVSYWAGDRGTANVRKNAGFTLVAAGPDLIRDAADDRFQVVRIYKRGGTIRVTVDDIVSVAFDDDGRTHGPVWVHRGWIGLRQMGHTVRCDYEYLKVYPLRAEKLP